MKLRLNNWPTRATCLGLGFGLGVFLLRLRRPPPCQRPSESLRLFLDNCERVMSLIQGY